MNKDFKVNMDLLKKIFIKNQHELLDDIEIYLRENGYEEIEKTKDYIYAKGNLPVLLAAHCDIVKSYKQIKDEIDLDFNEEAQILKVKNSKKHYLGADDRAGVYGLIECSKNENYKPYLLFTTEEEIFLFSGVFKFILNHKDLKDELYNHILYAIELDDHGKDHAAFYQTKNVDFEQFILSFGFSKQSKMKSFLSSTDVVQLSKAYNFASVNLCVGYYKQHTNKHILKVDELEETIIKVQEILDYTYYHQDSMNRYKSLQKQSFVTKLFLKFKLLLNRKISFLNFKYLKLKSLLNRMFAILYGGILGLLVGLILRGIKSLILK